MSPDKLIHMANQIALFMASKPEAEAEAGFAAHVNDFWPPVMRTQFWGLIEAKVPGFHPLVYKAAKDVRRPTSAA